MPELKRPPAIEDLVASEDYRNKIGGVEGVK